MNFGTSAGVEESIVEKSHDYVRIAAAIEFIRDNKSDQPTLADIARAIGLSEFHLQRLFSRWAGISPKRYLQVLTLEHAKSLLGNSADMMNASYELGLSGSGRLHDLFITLEAVTPGEFKLKGKGIEIRYGFHPTPFGDCLIGQTSRGICFLEFVADELPQEKLNRLRRKWHEAEFIEDARQTEETVSGIFETRKMDDGRLHLLVRGTNFQVKVWTALLQIPPGSVSTYSRIAAGIGMPKASRAVGSAIGTNPIAWLIPCHRVLRSDGSLGGYHWGETRKQACLAWEAARFVD